MNYLFPTYEEQRAHPQPTIVQTILGTFLCFLFPLAFSLGSGLVAWFFATRGELGFTFTFAFMAFLSSLLFLSLIGEAIRQKRL